MLSRFRKKKPADAAEISEAPVAAPKKKRGKPSLDTAKLKEFWLLHGEKVALGIVGAALLWSLWSFISTTVFDKVPEDLERLVTQAQNKLSQSQLTAEHPDWQKLQPVPIVDAARKTLVAVEVAGRALPEPFDPLVVPVDTKRDHPQVFAVEELQAHSDYGALKVQEGKRPGYRWVSVTGVVPWAQQKAEYNRCFGLSELRDQFGDEPTYYGYRVERAEVITGAPDEQLKWQPLVASKKTKVYAAASMLENVWDGQGAEVIDPALILPAISDPLPPLIGKTWGQFVAHPRLPVPVAAAPAEETPEEATPEDEQPESNDPFGSDSNAEDEPAGDEPADDLTVSADEPADEGAAAPADARPAAKPAGGGLAGNLQARAARAAAAVAAGGVAKPDAGPAGPAGRADTGRATPEQLRYRLFRFFDFDVEEGKQYRYRVKLALYNPNYQQPPRQLREQARQFADKEFLATEFSQPSPVVTVVRTNNVLAGAARSPRAPGVEPEAILLVRQFDLRGGVDMVVEKEKILRGQQLNFANEKALVRRPNGDVDSAAGIDFRTDAMLLDVLGGEPLKIPGQTSTIPAVYAYLDSEGRLGVRNELDDQEAFQATRPDGDLSTGSSSREEPAAAASRDDRDDRDDRPAAPARGGRTGGSLTDRFRRRAEEAGLSPAAP